MYHEDGMPADDKFVLKYLRRCVFAVLCFARYTNKIAHYTFSLLLCFFVVEDKFFCVWKWTRPRNEVRKVYFVGARPLVQFVVSPVPANSQKIFVVQRYCSCLQPALWKPTNELFPDLLILRFVIHNSQRFEERDEVVLDSIEDVYLLQEWILLVRVKYNAVIPVS